MSLKSELENALKEAMRAKDDIRKKAIRGAISAVKLAEVEKRGELEEGEVLAILQKEVKSQRESIADAEKAKRPDLIADSEAQIKVLEEFLPQALSQEELEKIVQECIAEVGASTMGEMGMVMKAVMPRVQGRAEGGQVNQIVKRLLGGG